LGGQLLNDKEISCGLNIKNSCSNRYLDRLCSPPNRPLLCMAVALLFLWGRSIAQLTLNSLGDAVLATNVAGHVSYLNRVAETMTGWSSQDGVGQPLEKVFHDVGEAHAMALKMMTMAQHDPLTGLVNRLLLIERITRAFGLAQRKNRNVALLYMIWITLKMLMIHSVMQ
jgi:PAS domain-containing protein